jgi:hypothetical protein
MPASVVPRVIADAGDKAARRFLEFFAATIRIVGTTPFVFRIHMQVDGRKVAICYDTHGVISPYLWYVRQGSRI